MKYILILLLTAFFVNLTKGSGDCHCTPALSTADKSQLCAEHKTGCYRSLGSYLQCLRDCGTNVPTNVEQQYNETCGTVALSVSLLTVLGALLVTAYRNLDL